jgi:uncharacterized protein (TIGR04141 family)
VNQGLVKALTGNPDDPRLGGKMTGMDALTVSVPADLAELPGLLVRYLEKYESTSYQTSFPWIDHLRAVRDKARKQELDDLLVARLRAGDRDRIWLAVPEILEQEDIEWFSYRRGRGAPRYHDTLLPDFLASVDDVAMLDMHDLTGRQVFGHRTSVPTMPKQWTVYRCLYAEIDQGADTFILYDGKWYRVRTDFVTDTNAEVARHVVTVPALLPFNVDTHKIEKIYHAAAAAADPRLLNMDRRCVRVDGNEIEFCDLFGDDRRMVHVKRYKASDSLSHLFNQGEVPARLLVQHRKFRQDVASKLSGSHQTLVDPDSFRPADFTVVFAITSESTKGIAESLPFFSRMTFVRIAGTLRSYGYNVELIKIDAIRGQPASQVQAPSLHPAVTTAVAASP